MRRAAAVGLALGLTVAGTVTVPAHAAPTCFGKTPSIMGTDGSDILEGTIGPDVIFAGKGSDTVRAGGGNDLICGGSGEDHGLFGQGGNDKIDAGTSERTTKVYGGTGNDFLYDAPGGGDGQEMFGGPGDDVLKAGDSNGTYIDVLDGGPGNDVMEQGGSEGVFIGGGGDDTMFGGRRDRGFDFLILDDAPGPVDLDVAAGTMTGWGNDTVEEIEVVGGGRFDDTMAGDGTRNYFVGGAGNDSLSGAGGNDCLLGAEPSWGGDHQVCIQPYRVEAGSGDDVLTGGAGDDLVSGGDGDDVIDGDEGFDRASFSGSASPVFVDLGAGTSTGDGTDSLQEVEEIVGSGFQDTLTGSERADSLIAYSSAGDVLRGLGGDDFLDAGIRETDLDGGAGNDTVTFLWGGPDDDTGFELDLRTDSDSAGNKLTSIENVLGPLYFVAVTLHGDDGPNSLTGGGADDRIFGYGGDDVLVGGYGNDELDGGAGEDLLEGGPGRTNGFDTCVNGETLRNCEA